MTARPKRRARARRSLFMMASAMLFRAGPTTAAPEPPREPVPEAWGAAGAEKYVGVNPGSSARNPLPAPSPKPTHLVWTGFKMTPDGSQVFLQTTQVVSYEIKGAAAPREIKKVGKAQKGAPHLGMSVFLKNCRIHLSNNRRTLDTRFFATPVAGVLVRQHHADVELRIALKENATPIPRTEPGPDGTQFLVLAFPPGTAAVPRAAASGAAHPSAEGPAPMKSLSPPAAGPIEPGRKTTP